MSWARFYILIGVGVAIQSATIGFTFGPTQIAHDNRIAEGPLQTDLESTAPWRLGDYIVKPRANYDIEARLLKRSRYWLDAVAGISPYDLALGWGEMSRSDNVNRLIFSHSDRFLYTNGFTPDFPVEGSEANTLISNNHVIPATDAIRKKLSRLRIGSIVHLSGKLVDVYYPRNGNPPWETSLTRTDTGAGACEVFWIESVR